ncbi:MAG: glycosyltransferase family 4 protein [Alphaproteobacteria bacterium]
MNILIVASKFPPEYTGPGVRIPKLYKAITNDLGVKRLDVLCNGIEQTENEDYQYENFNVKRRVAGALRKNKTLLKLPKRIHSGLVNLVESIVTYKALKEHKHQIDLIHTLGTSGGTAAALVWARKHNVPVLMELVTAQAIPVHKFMLLFKVRPPENTQIIALTKKAEKRCRALGFSEKQIWQRPNPINDKNFKIEGDKKLQYRETLSPFGSDDIVISTIGKMIPQKNHILLVKALQYLPERYKAIIAGPMIADGPLYARDKAYVETMGQLIGQHKLEGRVHMVLDFVNAADYMKASDIYAMPAWNEGFGTPMIEAMACGLPVIANANEPAFCEWIINGENGFLCDIDKPEEWAKAIERAAAIHEDKRREWALKIKEKAGQETIFSEYVARIRSLTEK